MNNKLVKLTLSDGTLIKDGQIEYIVGKNGIFRKISNNVIEGVIPVQGVPTLPGVKPAVKLKIPKKIPAQIYLQIFSFFTKFNTECYAQIFWNKEKQEYFVHIPRQDVSGASVKYFRNVELEKKFQLICEIHSHNTMGAFFSGTDDADEKVGIIYGVMSTTGIFNCKFRIKIFANEVEINPEDIFELPQVPRSWSKKVKKQELSAYINIGGQIRPAQQGQLFGDPDGKDDVPWWRRPDWGEM